MDPEFHTLRLRWRFLITSMGAPWMSCKRQAMAAIDVTKSAIRVAALVTALASMSLSARAQKGEDLREAAQNPIGDLISLPFQNNTNFDIGRSENTQNIPTFNRSIQPTLI